MKTRLFSGSTAASLMLVADIGLSSAFAADATPSDSAQTASNGWEAGQLDRIVKADDLHISVLRDDRVNYGTPTYIWCVQVDGGLYVRAYNGIQSRWYQATLKQKAGRIIAAGQTFDVTFEPVAGTLNDQIDLAYRAKYSSSNYLAPMISERSRAATVRVVPAGPVK